MLDPLIVARAIHFASTIMIGGAFAFSIFVGEPVWQRTETLPPDIAAPARLQLTRLIWFSLAVAVASGLAWLLVLAAEIGGESLSDALRDGTAWAVLTDTQFGFVWELRAVFAMILALLLLPGRAAGHWPRARRILMGCIAGLLLGSLTWAGHAAAAAGLGGGLHVISDIAHLLAAGTWLGGLVPLFLFMGHADRALRRSPSATPEQVLYRFSALGIVAAGTIAASGTVNTWFLTDHLRGVIGTDYGRLVLLKIGLFALMLCIAGVNRVRLTPRVAAAIDAAGSLQALSAWGQLRRNTAIEVAIGLAVICVVGALGVTMPSGHTHQP